MLKRTLIVLSLLVMIGMLHLSPDTVTIAHANGNDFTRVDGEVRGGSFSLFRPDDWNGDLVLLVHGDAPDLFEAVTPDLISQGFGVAFATQPPDLGVVAALKEITISTRIVQAKFAAHFGKPNRTYLYSFSRGGHNMTNLLETSPERYDGVLSVCGGNGGSQLQWDYFFTARVLFDYFFPDVLPGDPLSMPALDPDTFFNDVVPDIVEAISMNPAAAQEMAAVDQYNLQYNDLNELANGIALSLVVHSIGVNDVISFSNGNPFDNIQTVYTGTNDDNALNAGVVRLGADPQARQKLRVWHEPNGSIGGTPVLVLHMSRDPFVPERATNDKFETLVQSTGNADFLVRRVVDRFGHCDFSNAELASHFSDLVTWVETGVRPSP